MTSSTGAEMLIMRSSPAFARTRETRAKTRSHMSLERTGKAFEKYCEHDDNSPVLASA